MRENRTHGSEGGGAGYTTGPSYLYQTEERLKGRLSSARRGALWRRALAATHELPGAQPRRGGLVKPRA